MKSIYFLRPVGEKGPIKIGISVAPKSRLRSYQIWSPVMLELVASCHAHHNSENYLHRHFIKYWMHGEWFEWSEELQEIIDYVINHDELPAHLPIPTNWREYRDFRTAYPKGKTKGGSTLSIGDGG